MTEKPFNEMNNMEKRNYRNKLAEDGKGCCSGPLCKGTVKPLSEFHKNRFTTCRDCRNVHYQKSFAI